jgi:hypothetical protein
LEAVQQLRAISAECLRLANDQALIEEAERTLALLR